MKTLTRFLAFTCLAAAAWAQGTLNFNNNVTFLTSGDRFVRALDGTPLVGTEFVAQLYYGTHGTPEGSLVPVASNPARFRVPTTRMPGTWSGGTRTLDGLTAAQTATLQVRVWNLSLFRTYEAAVTGHGWHGASALFDYFVPGAGSDATGWFMNDFRGFTLVPESSSLALAALGVLGLVTFRLRTSTRRRGRFRQHDSDVATAVLLPGVVGRLTASTSCRE